MSDIAIAVVCASIFSCSISLFVFALACSRFVRLAEQIANGEKAIKWSKTVTKQEPIR